MHGKITSRVKLSLKLFILLHALALDSAIVYVTMKGVLCPLENDYKSKSKPVLFRKRAGYV